MAVSGVHESPPNAKTCRVSPTTGHMKAVPIPLYQLPQVDSLQSVVNLGTAALTTTVDSVNLSVVISSPLPTNIQKNSIQTLTLNLVNTLPILSPGYSPSIASANLAKSKNVGKHVCSHCGRDCLKPSVLEKHIRSHTGERPFPCTTCGISFKTQSNLYKHRRTQTHVNNTKLSLDSDVGRCLEDNVTCSLHEKKEGHVCIDTGQSTQCEMTNTSSKQENNLKVFISEDISSQANSLQPSHGSCGKTQGEHVPVAIISPTVLNQRRMLKDQRSPTAGRQIQLQRQYETCVEYTPSDRKLKKCESTDSGYLSHSDSADLQMFSGSPLHSLSECSIESEHVLSRSSLHVTSEDYDDKSVTGKKRLEEHIAMLISQNQAVVEDTHLDNVRPRKTALSKQGSIDLPMPYTFKDSFHFDIRSLDMNRKKVSLCSAKSTFAPMEKTRPLFFHSVPTQFSTTTEHMTVTRCNSLPFAENCRFTQERQTSTSLSPVKQPLDTTLAKASALTLDLSSSHPRGLVRQTAVDEIPTNHLSEGHIPEEMKSKKKLADDRTTSKCKTTSKRGGPKKMFSHEKWQMYGDETFKKLYQKMQKNENARKAKQGVAEQKILGKNQKHPTAVGGTVNFSDNRHSSVKVSPLSSQETASVEISQEPIKNMETQTQSENLHDSSDCIKKTSTMRSGIDCDVTQKDVQECGLEIKLATSVSSIQTEFPQALLTDQGGDSDLKHVGIISPEVQSKVSSVSYTDKNTASFRKESFNNSKRIYSERKKLKVTEVKDMFSVVNSEHFVTDNNDGNDQVLSYKSSVDPLQKEEVHSESIEDGRYGHHDNMTPLLGDPQLLKENKPSSSSQPNLKYIAWRSFGRLSAKNQIMEKDTQQSTEVSPTMEENIFSPRYLIKLPCVGQPVEVSQESDHNLSFEETMVGSVNSVHTEDGPPSMSIFPCQVDPLYTLPSEDNIIMMYPCGINSHSLKARLSQLTVSVNQGQELTPDYQKGNNHHDTLDKTQSTNMEQNEVQLVNFDPSFSRSFLISSELHCPDDILQQPRGSNHMIHSTMTQSINSGEKYEMASRSGDHELISLVTEHSREIRLHSVDNLKSDQASMSQQTKLTGAQGMESLKNATKPLTVASGKYNGQASQVSFSLLNTEAYPTWCWLNKRVPLPAEQKEKTFSVYASLTKETLKEKSLRSRIHTPSQEETLSVTLTTTGNVEPLVSSIPWRSQKHKENVSTVFQDPWEGEVQTPHSTKYLAPERVKEMDVASRFSSTEAQMKMKAQKRCDAFRQEISNTGAENKPAGVEILHYKTIYQVTSCDQDDHYRPCKPPESGTEEATLEQTMAKQSAGDTSPQVVGSGTVRPFSVKMEEGGSRDKKEDERISEDIVIKASLSASIRNDQSARSDRLVRTETISELENPEFLQEASFNLQKSTSYTQSKEINLPERSLDSHDLPTSDVKRVYPKQGLRDSPPQKHIRRVLQRSKTMEAGLIDHTFSDSSLFQTEHITVRPTLPRLNSLATTVAPMVTPCLKPFTVPASPMDTLCLKPLSVPPPSMVTPCLEPLGIVTTSVVAQSMDYLVVPTTPKTIPCLDPLQIPKATMATLGLKPFTKTTAPLAAPCARSFSGHEGPMTTPCLESLGRSAGPVATLCPEAFIKTTTSMTTQNFPMTIPKKDVVSACPEPASKLHTVPVEGIGRPTSSGSHDPQGATISQQTCVHPQRSANLPQMGHPPAPNLMHPTVLQSVNFKSQRKLSLQVMKKHTRVEYSDTSSDDEDRLVIEM
ncbi:zinc finger protein 831 [Spea bombifrons]|uniref:zinc finger protein 831 n=1 Tax=Spea bombifrons TaxID=233779 RepID=UPI002349DBE0|nr:zinc finger protein 831 [Spea bombifrons]